MFGSLKYFKLQVSKEGSGRLLSLKVRNKEQNDSIERYIEQIRPNRYIEPDIERYIEGDIERIKSNRNIKRNVETLIEYCGGAMGENGFFNFSETCDINEPLSWRYPLNNKDIFMAEYFIAKGLRGQITIKKSSRNSVIKVRDLSGPILQ